MSRHGRRIPLKPLPADSTLCRWCEGPKKPLHEGQIARCVSGCVTDDAPERFLNAVTCEDCGGEFLTGERMPARQCWQCEDAEMGRQRRSAVGERRSTVFMDRQQDRVSRRIVAERPS